MKPAHFRRSCGAGFVFVFTLVTMFPRFARGQEVLYGITFDTNQLIRINTSTGVGTAVGTIGFNASAIGISSYNGELYVLDQNNDQLIVVDPNTAATVRTVHVMDEGVLGVFSEGDFEIRASDGKGFYTESNGAFQSVNIQTGAWSLISSSQPINIDGLAFSSGGTLYALQSTGQLYTVDANTGSATLIGGSGSFNSFAGMDFRADGVLYAATNNRLFTINPATGAETDIGVIGFAGVSGLTFLNVPEPATGGAIALAGALLLARRQRA